MDVTAGETAVVVVHMQGDIAGEGGAFAPVFHAQVVERGIVPVIASVVTAARSAGARVVYPRVAWAPDYSDLLANSPLLQMVVQLNALKEGTEAAEIIPELRPHDVDLIHTHHRMGGFTPDLDDQLETMGISTVAFCGVATNASVEGMARQASDAGYRVVLIEDGCSAATPEAHRASIESLGLVGEVVSSADLIAALTEQ